MNYKIFFISRSLFCGLGLSYILSLSKQGIIISELIGFILGLIILKYLKNYNINLKWTVNILFIIISCSVLVNLGHSLYLNNTPISILTIFSIFSVLIFSKIKDKRLNKLCQFLYIYSLILFIIKFLLLLKDINLTNFLPLYDIKFSKVILGSLIFSISGILPILSLNNKRNELNINKIYSISMLTVIGLSFLIVSVMGIKEAEIYRYPEYVVLKRIKLLNFITNVDNIFAFQLVCDLFFTMTLGIKNLKELSNKNNKKFYILIFFIVILSSLIVYLNWPILLIYEYFPLWLFIVFISILIPKKSMYKKYRN